MTRHERTPSPRHPSPATRHLHVWRLLVLGCSTAGILLHIGLGCVLLLQYQRQVWHEDGKVGKEGPSELAAAIAAHVPQGATILYVTEGTREEQWTYFYLSYALYPSKIWWAAPVERSSPVDWWISCPLTAQAVTALAAKLDARHVIWDGPDVPDALRASSLSILETRTAGETPAIQFLQQARKRVPEGKMILAIGRLGLSLIAIVNLGHLAIKLAVILLQAPVLADGFHPQGDQVSRRPLGERLALGFLVGTGILSLIAFYVSLICAPAALRTTAIVAMAGLLYSAVKGGYRAIRRQLAHASRQACPDASTAVASNLALPSPVSEATPTPWRWRSPQFWLSLPLAIVLLCQVLGMAVSAFKTGLGWDGLAIWGLKAKIFFIEGGVPPTYWADLSRQWSHLDYPLLFPLSEAWVYTWLGDVDECLVKALFAEFFVSLLTILYCAIRRLRSNPGDVHCPGESVTRSAGRPEPALHALVWPVVLCATPMLLAVGPSGYVDLPFSAFVFGGSAYLYAWLKCRRAEDLVLGALLSAWGMWGKQEGIIVWLLGLFAVLITSLRTRQVQRTPSNPGESRTRRLPCVAPRVCPASLGRGKDLKAILIYLLPALCVGPWFLVAARHALPENDFAPLTLQAAVANAHRLPILLGLLGQKLLAAGAWGAVWMLFPLAVLYSSPRTISPGQGYLLFVVSAYLGLLIASLAFSRWQPYTLHAQTSLDRLILHVTPTALFFIAIRLGHAQAPFPTSTRHRWYS